MSRDEASEGYLERRFTPTAVSWLLPAAAGPLADFTQAAIPARRPPTGPARRDPAALCPSPAARLVPAPGRSLGPEDLTPEGIEPQIGMHPRQRARKHPRVGAHYPADSITTTRRRGASDDREQSQFAGRGEEVTDYPRSRFAPRSNIPFGRVPPTTPVHARATPPISASVCADPTCFEIRCRPPACCAISTAVAPYAVRTRLVNATPRP